MIMHFIASPACLVPFMWVDDMSGLSRHFRKNLISGTCALSIARLQTDKCNLYKLCFRRQVTLCIREAAPGPNRHLIAG